MSYGSRKTSRGWVRRTAGFLVSAALALGLLGAMSACARRDVAVLSDRQPGLDLAEFFAGDSVAHGIFETGSAICAPVLGEYDRNGRG